jgi:hypothetical protein
MDEIRTGNRIIYWDKEGGYSLFVVDPNLSAIEICQGVICYILFLHRFGNQ